MSEQITVRGNTYLVDIDRTRQGWTAVVHRDRQLLGEARWSETMALRQMPPVLAHLEPELRALIEARRTGRAALTH